MASFPFWDESMKSCRHCGNELADEHQFCLQCGQPVDQVPASGAPAADATTLMNRSGGGPQIPVDVFTSKAGVLHRSIPVDELFAFKSQLLIGRASTCDICLPHFSISRVHALLERRAEGLLIKDLHSINGVLVGGRRIAAPVILRDRERVGIGPYLFSLAGGVLHALDSSQSMRLEGFKLDKVIAVGGGHKRKLLDNINLVVEPGEFVSLLGPSGSGKSTLMDCLNGRRPPTSGQVLANGEDFYRHFDTFRQSLGYVPQRDIVHVDLTVYKALYYTARLRLPPDTSAAELQTRINEVLGLMELEPHRDTRVGNLSGGQIKRVSLGAELLARPCLLFIDEATSGLDAGTEARMMRLFRLLAHEGKSVLCITHNVDHVNLCDLLLILNTGKLVFYGPPAESLVYFKTPRVSEIYDRLAEKSPEAWEKEFAACSLHRTFVENRLASAPAESIMTVAAPVLSASEPASSLPKRPHPPFLHQFRVLTARYLELIWRDPRTLRLLILQAPLVSVIIFLSFLNKPFQNEILSARPLNDEEHALLTDWLARLQTIPPEARQESLGPALERLARRPGEADKVTQLLATIPLKHATVQDVCDKGDMLLRNQGPMVPEKLIGDPTNTYVLCYLLVITILWFGCNNAAKEIVKEEAVYARERAVNLGILPYLASKFVVLSFISAVQVLCTMGIIYGGLEIFQSGDVPNPLYRLDYLPQFGFLLLLSMTGVALGLLLSACVGNPDRAATLLPYVLIPQIILGGGILPMDTPPLNILAYVASPTYWAYRAIRTGETELPESFPWQIDYNDNNWIAAGALTAQMLGMLLVTAWLLRRRDVRKA
jgi:ABC-type multidrug transport system ATPase subunit